MTRPPPREAHITCKACQGAGTVFDDDTEDSTFLVCSSCHGMGYILINTLDGDGRYRTVPGPNVSSL